MEVKVFGGKVDIDMNSDTFKNFYETFCKSKECVIPPSEKNCLVNPCTDLFNSYKKIHDEYNSKK